MGQNIICQKLFAHLPMSSSLQVLSLHISSTVFTHVDSLMHAEKVTLWTVNQSLVVRPSGCQCSDLQWILQTAFSFRQIICTSHAQRWYAIAETKVKQCSCAFISLISRDSLASLALINAIFPCVAKNTAQQHRYCNMVVSSWGDWQSG